MQENNNEITGQVNQTDNGGEVERSEKRYRDLSNKVKTAEEKNAVLEAEKADLLKQKQESDFKANFLEAKAKYPAAEEFKADIQAKVSSGYALEDAIVSTLASKGKLNTPTDLRSQVSGDSVATHIPVSDKSDPSFGGDRGKMLEELKRLESTGEIGMRF